MEGVPLALSVVHNLLTALKSPDLIKMSSTYDMGSCLNELHDSVCFIKTVFLAAETKHELSFVERVYIQKLQDAVYDADDLLDELVTLFARKPSEEVRRYFSADNPVISIFKISRQIKDIGERLKGLVSDDANKYDLSIDFQPIRTRMVDISYFSSDYGDAIVGRDVDVEKIVGMLLDSNTERDVNFLSIVGTSGVGKTTLAKLVYNDHRISDEFSIRKWLSVSDSDCPPFDAQRILRCILASVASQSYEEYPLGSMQHKAQEIIRSEKFLLVLDDVWTECLEDWRMVEQVLLGGSRGSWVVITTRSRRTASMIGCGSTYELQGLSREDSWRLFEEMAFKSGNKVSDDQDFVKIGEQIVDKCLAIPLALRVIGSLLYGQDKSKWLSIWI